MSQSSSGLTRLARLDAEIRKGPTHTYVTHHFRGWQEQPVITYVWRRTYENISRGGFGAVFLEECQEGSTAGAVRAVKCLQKPTSSSSRKIDYGRELEAIARFSQPKYTNYFVRSDGWYETRDAIYITMEYLKHGDLEQYVGSGLPEREVQSLIYQVLRGLKCMHELRYAHRDLKPSNLLVVNKGPAWHIKIADFGLSKQVREDASSLRTAAGTPGYMAPEMLGLYDEDDDRADDDGPEARQPYTDAVDLWAVGAISFYLLSGTLPFSAVDLRSLGRYVRGRTSLPSEALESRGVSALGWNLIKDLMSVKPGLRPSVTACLDHPWLRIARHSTVSELTQSLQSTTIEQQNSTETASASWGTTDSGYRTVTRSRLSAHPTETTISRSDTIMTRSLGHSSPIRTIATASDAGLLATNSDDGKIVLWRSDSGEPFRNPAVPGAKPSTRIVMVAISPDGRYLACTSSDGYLRLWDSTSAAGGKVFAPPSTVKRKVRGDIVNSGHVCLAFSPDGSILASGMTERRERKNWSAGMVELFDVATGTSIRTLQGYHGSYVWAEYTGDPAERMMDRPREHDVDSLSFSPNGVFLSTAGPGRYITIFKVKSGEKEDSLDCLGLTYHRHQRHNADEGTKLAKFSRDSRILATAHTGKSLVALWDTTTWKVFQKVGDDTKFWQRPHGLDVSFDLGLVTMAFAPFDDLLAIKSPKHIYLYNIVTMRMVKKFAYSQHSLAQVLAFSKDGRSVITDYDDGRQIQMLVWQTTQETDHHRRLS